MSRTQLAHIKHMNHGSQFQKLWSTLRSEVSTLQQRGYYGDGAYGALREFYRKENVSEYRAPFFTPFSTAYSNVFDTRFFGFGVHDPGMVIFRISKIFLALPR